MFREILIYIYLVIFKIIFKIFNILLTKSKIIFVASFSCNTSYVVKKAIELTTYEVIVLNTSKKAKIIENINRVKELKFSIFRFHNFIKGIYHLATSKVIFVDNYFPFLSITKFKENVKCIQLWHAVGAMKKFGLTDASIKFRPLYANKRFKRVYSRFDVVVVGSRKMGEIFRKNFGIDDNKILQGGVPRTDFFFDEVKINKIKKSLYVKYKFDRSKKIILYAPTYRDGKFSVSNCTLDIKLMYCLKKDYILLLKFHPLVYSNFKNKYEDFVIDVSGIENINRLLTITDILITDYSSIPFEFSLFNKPMIFYDYDFEEYKEKRGIVDEYENLVPGPIVKTTKEVVKLILENNFDLRKIKAFSEEWNEFSIGSSSENVVKYILE